jgi:hypothetical protein
VSALARGVELDSRTVDDLAMSFGGSLIRPDDTTYDEQRRVWNASIDRRPALIAQCAGVADVISAVRLARDQEQLVARCEAAATATRGWACATVGWSSTSGG